MESIRALINKLHQQAEQHADPSTLMITVQSIQNELARLTAAAPRKLGTSKVAVVLPAHKFAYPQSDTDKEPAAAELQAPVVHHHTNHRAMVKEPVKERYPLGEPAKEPVKEWYTLSEPAKEPVREHVTESRAPVAEPVKQAVPLPVWEAPKEPPAQETPKEPLVREAPKEASRTAAVPAQQPQQPNQPGWSFDAIEETPTLSHQKEFKEMNDTFGQFNTSLNDKLKSEKTDLAAVLKEGPIRDLKKAIGVNDRFVFMAELFRGDETMYERSIKTINNFRIYPEAEYWIERELKVKLGWDENKDAVKQFRQLVKRRFL